MFVTKGQTTSRKFGDWGCGLREMLRLSPAIQLHLDYSMTILRFQAVSQIFTFSVCVAFFLSNTDKGEAFFYVDDEHTVDA